MEERRPCPNCSEQIIATATLCRFCKTRFDATGKPIPVATSDPTGGLIPLKNPHALIAYYLGVFSLIPLFPIGLAGVVLGVMGMRNASRNPAVKGQIHALIGIIVGGIFGLLYLVGTVTILMHM